jgi:hypothetical protein
MLELVNLAQKSSQEVHAMLVCVGRVQEFSSGDSR